MSVIQEVRRADLARSITNDLARVQVTDNSDGLTIDGLFVVFNSRTLIDSWEGAFYEEAAPGSTRKSLRERTPLMQFDHGQHPLLGSLPMGIYTSVGEEEAGARGIGRLSDNWLIEPFRMAIADGGVRGMSYRFGVVREEWRDQEGNLVKPQDVPAHIYRSGLSESDLLIRTLKEVRITEAGPVVWPAYETTSVGVRSKVTIDLGRLADPDQRQALATAVAVADATERGDSPLNLDADHAAPAGHLDAVDSTTDAPLPDEHPSPTTPTPSQRRREQEHALIAARLDLALKGATRYVGD